MAIDFILSAESWNTRPMRDAAERKRVQTAFDVEAFIAAKKAEQEREKKREADEQERIRADLFQAWKRVRRDNGSILD